MHGVMVPAPPHSDGPPPEHKIHVPLHGRGALKFAIAQAARETHYPNRCGQFELQLVFLEPAQHVSVTVGSARAPCNRAGKLAQMGLFGRRQD